MPPAVAAVGSAIASAVVSKALAEEPEVKQMPRTTDVEGKVVDSGWGVKKAQDALGGSAGQPGRALSPLPEDNGQINYAAQTMSPLSPQQRNNGFSIMGGSTVGQRQQQPSRSAMGLE